MEKKGFLAGSLSRNRIYSMNRVRDGTVGRETKLQRFITSQNGILEAPSKAVSLEQSLQWQIIENTVKEVDWGKIIKGLEYKAKDGSLLV